MILLTNVLLIASSEGRSEGEKGDPHHILEGSFPLEISQLRIFPPTFNEYCSHQIGGGNSSIINGSDELVLEIINQQSQTTFLLLFSDVEERDGWANVVAYQML